MNTADVVEAGLEDHPESGAELLRIEVAFPWRTGGQRANTTYLWVDRKAPRPNTGDEVSWNHHYCFINGIRWAKPEDDANPDAPLH